jgi:hypothetical protein
MSIVSSGTEPNSASLRYEIRVRFYLFVGYCILHLYLVTLYIIDRAGVDASRSFFSQFSPFTNRLLQRRNLGFRIYDLMYGVWDTGFGMAKRDFEKYFGLLRYVTNFVWRILAGKGEGNGFSVLWSVLV